MTVVRDRNLIIETRQLCVADELKLHDSRLLKSTFGSLEKPVSPKVKLKHAVGAGGRGTRTDWARAEQRNPPTKTKRRSGTATNLHDEPELELKPA